MNMSHATYGKVNLANYYFINEKILVIVKNRNMEYGNK